MTSRSHFLKTAWTLLLLSGWNALAQHEAPPSATFELSLTFPLTRQVFQRSVQNEAAIPLRGRCPAGTTRVEARLRPRQPDQGTATDWTTIDANPAATFHGHLTGRGGWYDLELRAVAGEAVTATTVLPRVGIGEVFIVVGHSVAAGQDINLDGATDDRVETIALEGKGSELKPYIFTGDPQHLPELRFSHFGRGVKPAPFGGGTYFWSNFGELVAQRENVPVLMYNAAFGGTSLEHWAKSARGTPFEHTFVRAPIRMPYINLRNALTKYVPFTGLRAILADQGQNDWPEKSADAILQNYLTWVQQARTDLGHPALAIVVNRQTPFLRDRAVREAQERMIASPHCFPGPDYDTLAKEARPDAIHLGASGAAHAAKLWAEALTPDFFQRSQPWLPPQK